MNKRGRRAGLILVFEAAACALLIFSLGCDAGMGSFASGTVTRQPAQHWLQPASGETQLDLGIVEGGKEFTHVLRFVNRGKSAVRLSNDIKTSCGCTEATLTQLELAPGEEGSVSLRIQPATEGASRQAVNVFIPVVEPAGLPSAQFGIVFSSMIGWKVAPGELRFTGQSGTPQQAVLRVFGSDLRDVRILGVSSDLPNSMIDFKDATIRSDSNVLVRLSFVLPGAEGDSSFQLVIDTDDPQVPRREIPVFCRVIPTYQTVPRQILVSCVGEQPVTQNVMIRAERGFSLGVDHTNDVPGLIATISDGEIAKTEQRLQVTVEPSEFETGLHRHVVKFVARSADTQEQIEVSVIVVVKSPKDQGEAGHLRND